ncbi:MAG: hypothetical protein MJA27_30855, partial [Pseudanabaenales cyanobacterium]|nr:hypothetical protein [Pseudanabaenales cyanobacterium]
CIAVSPKRGDAALAARKSPPAAEAKTIAYVFGRISNRYQSAIDGFSVRSWLTDKSSLCRLG